MTAIDRAWLESDQAYGDMLDSDHDVTLEDYRLESLVGCADCLRSTVESLESANEGTSLEGYRLVTREILGEDEVSLEGIKEKLAKAWEAIKRSVKQAIDKIMAYFHKMFKGTKALSKLVDEMAKETDDLRRAKSLPKSTTGAKAPTIKFSKLSLIAVNDNPTDKSILGAIDSTNRVIGDARKAYLDSAISAFSAASDYALEGAKALNKGGDDMHSELWDVSQKLEKDIANAYTKPFERLRSAEKTLLPGGKSIAVQKKPFTQDDVLELKLVDNGEAYNGDNMVPVASLGDIKRMLVVIRDGIRNLDDSKSDSETLLAKQRDTMEAQDKLIKAIPNEELNEALKKAQSAWDRIVYWLLRSGTVSNINRLSFYQYRVIRTSLMYVKESLAQYEK